MEKGKAPPAGKLYTELEASSQRAFVPRAMLDLYAGRITPEEYRQIIKEANRAFRRFLRKYG